MSQQILVDDMVAEVRSLLDEHNQLSVTDTGDIIPALNRGQNYAANILSRHYTPPLLKHVLIPTVSGQKEYELPNDAFEQKIEFIEVFTASTGYYPLEKKPFRTLSYLENVTQSVSIPTYWATVGQKFRLYPMSNGQYPLRVWYQQDPLKLELSQGRINVVASDGTYLIVDGIGSDLTVASDQLKSYFHVVNGNTGVVKGTFQAKSIFGNRVNISSSPTRSTVMGFTIDSNLNNLSVNTPDASGEREFTVTIAPDDYICIINGTCVPFFKKPFVNFITEYAVQELKRKLGEMGDQFEKMVLDKLEKEVELSWVGQLQTIPVVRNDRNWSPMTRRLLLSNTTGSGR